MQNILRFFGHTLLKRWFVFRTKKPSKSQHPSSKIKNLRKLKKVFTFSFLTTKLSKVFSRFLTLKNMSLPLHQVHPNYHLTIFMRTWHENYLHLLGMISMRTCHNFSPIIPSTFLNFAYLNTLDATPLKSSLSQP